MRKVPDPIVAPGHCVSRVWFLGAVEGDVTGSMHLVELFEYNKVTRILIDVGQTIENPKADWQNRLPNELIFADIDIVIVGHAHLDHSGLAPLMYKQGYRGKIFVTRATGDLMEILLPDSGKIQESDAKRENLRAARKADTKQADAARLLVELSSDPSSKHATKRSGHKRGGKAREEAKPKEVQPLYTEQDAKDSLTLVERVNFFQRCELAPGVVATFLPASHILGAAMVHLELGWNGEKRSCLFAGNIGRKGMPLLRDISSVLACDYVFMESTYGNREHLVRDDLAALAVILNPALERASKPNAKTGYGAVVIPVFSVGRAQVLLDRIRRLKAAGIIPNGLKVYLDSPMSIKCTEVHRREEHRHFLNDETQAIFASGNDPFRFPGLVEVQEFRKDLLEPLSEPCIILCSPGMGNGGRALSQLDLRVEADNSTLLFVGYQGRGTVGSALLAARNALLEAAQAGRSKKSFARYVNIMGRKRRVNATIEFMGDYSAHGDWQDIIRLLVQIVKLRTPKMVFLEHGDLEAVDALEERVKKLVSLKVTKPRLKEWFIL